MSYGATTDPGLLGAYMPQRCSSTTVQSAGSPLMRLWNSGSAELTVSTRNTLMPRPSSQAFFQIARGSLPGDRSPGCSLIPQTPSFLASCSRVVSALGSATSTPTMALNLPGNRSIDSSKYALSIMPLCCVRTACWTSLWFMPYSSISTGSNQLVPAWQWVSTTYMLSPLDVWQNLSSLSPTVKRESPLR